MFYKLALISDKYLQEREIFSNFVHNMKDEEFFLQKLQHHDIKPTVKRNILLVPECHKAIECSSIGFRCSDFSQLFQLSYDTMHKGKERGLLGQFMEHGDHVVSCEATTLRFQRADNLFQTSHVPCQTFLNTQQKVRTITIYDNAFRLCIPFLCKDLVICIHKKNTGNASVPIDMEEAYLLASEADMWLHTGMANTLDELKAACPKFTDTRCFRNGYVYNNNARTNAAGGNDYYESAVVRPDLVLRDLVKIFHPELVAEDFVYYKQLK